MDLGNFFDHVKQWAETLWHDRVEATLEEEQKNEEILKKKPETPKKEIDMKPPKKNATYHGQPLSEEQKQFSFGQ